MLDLKFIRANPDAVKDACVKKRVTVDVDRILALDARRGAELTAGAALTPRRTPGSTPGGMLKKAGQDTTAVQEEMRAVGDRIKALDDESRDVEQNLQDLLLTVPNLPDPDVPVGEDDAGNVEVRRWGTPREFAFPPKAHWDIGTGLDVLDFERAAKVTAARFTIMKGGIVRLNRALVDFFFDHHVANGYREMWIPDIVNTASYFGSGQFPKFKEDVFSLAGTELHLSATAEVPLVNMHRDEILPAELLPVKYAGYSNCYRSEAGAAGRDTRGLIRQHMFDKVEMVQFTTPEGSSAALDEIVASAEALLQKLNLPYRVLFMCTGDMGFGQRRKYDLEVWMPSYGRYVEISSCSNMGDFQARRANIRYRPGEGAKPEFVHTLNGSGLALGRTVAAVLENYQEADGTVTVPAVLRPYVGGLERISG